jgi:hypothetical protein
MSLQLIDTALLLGVFILLAGGYGLFYSIGKLKRNRNWINAGYVCYFSQVIITILIVLYAPLGVGWLLLIIASCVACFKIPPMAFYYLELTHG